jgi:hypothetical protein
VESTPPAPPTAPTLGYERTPAYVPVARFHDSAEAAMAASSLTGHDLDFELIEHTRLHGMGARGATLAVAAADVPRAVELLSSTPARRCLVVERAVPAELGMHGAEPALLRWLRRIRPRD